MNEQRPSDIAKAAGLKSLKEISDATGKSVQTLNNWHKDEPDLFRIVVKGVAAEKFAHNLEQI